jgi:hypothetical protein
MDRFLWQEDGSIVYNCCWPSPAQSFSGPSPVGLATIFYCVRFETRRVAVANSPVQMLRRAVSRVDFTPLDNTVIAFPAVTVLLTVRCHNQLKLQNPTQRSSAVYLFTAYPRNVCIQSSPSNGWRYCKNNVYAAVGWQWTPASTSTLGLLGGA